jgi:hypothetical protein
LAEQRVKIINFAGDPGDYTYQYETADGSTGWTEYTAIVLRRGGFAVVNFSSVGVIVVRKA